MNKTQKLSPVIGLTGQSGAGKTTAAKIFRDENFAVIDADIAAREVVEPGTVCLRDIAECFGNDMICKNGCLDRKKLGEKVFSDKNMLMRLNNIIYPHINRRIEALIGEYSADHPYILLDAPTLFEAGADKFCAKIISVTAPREIRLKRITARDNISEEMALRRFDSQLSEEYFRQKSDYVIENNGDEEAFREKVKAVCAVIKELYDAKDAGS
ncbi:MAG: dephospho-CoA kinase [Huintestinicola sp.]